MHFVRIRFLILDSCGHGSLEISQSVSHGWLVM
jgi:hypothetical protein